MNGNSHHKWFRRVTCGVAGGAALLALIAIMLPSVGSRPAPKRGRCANNLKAIGVAMHDYHDVYGCCPPAYTTDKNGRPMHSWRVLLLPFLGREDLYEKYDLNEPWDSPKNIDVFRHMPDVFSCPASGEETGL